MGGGSGLAIVEGFRQLYEIILKHIHLPLRALKNTPLIPSQEGTNNVRVHRVKVRRGSQR
jgi:hypothetical protein